MSTNLENEESHLEDARMARQTQNYRYKLDWPEIEEFAPESASYLSMRLERLRELRSLSARLNDEQQQYEEIGLINDFLIRASKAVRSTICLVLIGNDEDAWTIVRVIIEHCIRLNHLLMTGKTREFFEYRALELKTRTRKAVSLGFVSRASADEFDAKMRETFGHTLGRPKPLWDRLPDIKEVCDEVYGKETGRRVYLLYRGISGWAHPGVGGYDEYDAEVMTTLGQDRRWGTILDYALDSLDSLLDIAEPKLRQHAQTSS